jgi:hypothetical protein
MASKAWTARSTVITKTRSPATRGGVTALAGTRLRQASRWPSKVTTSLPRVTTLMKRPSLPSPAEMGPPTPARHRMAPVSAARAATSPSAAATSTLPSRTAGISTASRLEARPRIDGFSRVLQTALPAILAG